MPVWFILITTKPAEEHSVYLALKKMNEVEYVYPLFDDWDFIVKIVGETSFLEKYLMENIKTLDGVIDTKTLIGL